MTNPFNEVWQEDRDAKAEHEAGKRAELDYQAGVEAERKRCVGVLVREALHGKKYAWRCARAGNRNLADTKFNRSLALMIIARELYGPRKGDDNGNG